MTGIFDIHCHLLPGVDDGSDSLEETIKMMEMEYEQGVRTIFATPHFRKKMFEPPMEKVLERFERVKKEADRIGMALYLGCEFHVNMDMAETLRNKERPTLAGSPYVLTEFSGAAECDYVRDRCFSLLSSGFIPLIAHIERYPQVVKNMGFIEELSEMGVKISVNAESILGQEGYSLKKFCKKLIKSDLLDFIGSDAHGTKHRAPQMGACAELLTKKYGADYTMRIMKENPEEILKEGKRN